MLADKFRKSSILKNLLIGYVCAKVFWIPLRPNDTRLESTQAFLEGNNKASYVRLVDNPNSFKDHKKSMVEFTLSTGKVIQTSLETLAGYISHENGIQVINADNLNYVRINARIVPNHFGIFSKDTVDAHIDFKYKKVLFKGKEYPDIKTSVTYLNYEKPKSPLNPIKLEHNSGSTNTIDFDGDGKEDYYDLQNKILTIDCSKTTDPLVIPLSYLHEGSYLGVSEIKPRFNAIVFNLYTFQVKKQDTTYHKYSVNFKVLSGKEKKLPAYSMRIKRDQLKAKPRQYIKPQTNKRDLMRELIASE